MRRDVISRRKERWRRHVGDQHLRSFWTERVEQRHSSGSWSVPRQLRAAGERATSSQRHVQQRKHSRSVCSLFFTSYSYPTPTLSVSVGRTFESACLSVCLSVCLFVCTLQHNSKTNDPNVFNLGVGNESLNEP